MSALPLVPPRTRTALSERFWRAARERRLEFQRCDSCGFTRWPPSAVCPECLAAESTWVAVEPRGTVWSYCVYEHCYDDAFREAMPYVVALVELDSGPRLITNVLAQPKEVRVGMIVEAVFDVVADDAAVVRFRPTPDQGES
jgi:uncharacterized OB-fold protein